MQTNYFAYR